MDRRRFVKSLLPTLGGLSLPPGAEVSTAGSKVPKACPQDNKLTIDYIREEIPHFEIPPYRGTSYEDTVPDTLDIAERAQLAIHCVTSIADPRADYEIFQTAQFFRNPPVMVHDFNDSDFNGEGMIEGLPLLRILTGSTLNEDVDRVWMETLLKCIGPDGLLYYLPFQGRPWSRMGMNWVQPVWRANGTATDPSDQSVRQVTNPYIWTRAVAAMTIYYLRDKNPMWKQTIERMIQRMSEIATDEGDYIFFPAGGYEPNARFGAGDSASDQVMPTGLLAVEGGNGRLIQGLSQYYRVTGYEPAGQLAGKLVEFLRHQAHYYDPEGRFLFSHFEKNNAKHDFKQHYPQLNVEGVDGQRLGGHFHAHTLGLLSVLEYAGTIRDRELLQWVRSGYEWAKTQGSSLVGFFPEMIIPDYPSCESCEVADMIGMAVKLSTAGVGDYWDDIDRWTRNQFAENQLTEGEWIYRMAESQPKRPVAFNETADRVAERSLGAFAGWASGNEWGISDGIMHCCTSNSMRSLYYIWQHMLQNEDGQLRVNLLLNRASKWADVHSYIPYEGRVDLCIKQACRRVLVRVPEWMEDNSPQVACKVSGVSRELRWEGRYVDVGAGKAGDTIVVTFPFEERRVREKLGDRSYTLVMKGNTVVSIDPPGKNGALYARASYRENRVHWRKAKRFVAEEEISW